MYTAAERAIAVATYRVANASLEKALEAVRDILKSPTLSKSTLSEWVHDANDVKDFAQATANGSEPSEHPLTAREMWRQTRENYLNRANEPAVIELTTGKDAVIAAERAQKIEQLLDGLPTEIIDAAPALQKLNELWKQLNITPSEALEDYYQRLHAKVMVKAEADHV